MKPALTIVSAKPAARFPGYADIPQAARDDFHALQATVGRLSRFFGGPQTPAHMLPTVEAELTKAEALIKATRSSLRSGR